MCAPGVLDGTNMSASGVEECTTDFVDRNAVMTILRWVRKMPRSLAVRDVALIIVPVRMIAERNESEPLASVQKVMAVHYTLDLHPDEGG